MITDRISDEGGEWPKKEEEERYKVSLPKNDKKGPSPLVGGVLGELARKSAEDACRSLFLDLQRREVIELHEDRSSFWWKHYVYIELPSKEHQLIAEKVRQELSQEGRKGLLSLLRSQGMEFFIEPIKTLNELYQYLETPDTFTKMGICGRSEGHDSISSDTLNKIRPGGAII